MINNPVCLSDMLIAYQPLPYLRSFNIESVRNIHTGTSQLQKTIKLESGNEISLKNYKNKRNSNILKVNQYLNDYKSKIDSWERSNNHLKNLEFNVNNFKFKNSFNFNKFPKISNDSAINSKIFKLYNTYTDPLSIDDLNRLQSWKNYYIRQQKKEEEKKLSLENKSQGEVEEEEELDILDLIPEVKIKDKQWLDLQAYNDADNTNNKNQINVENLPSLFENSKELNEFKTDFENLLIIHKNKYYHKNFNKFLNDHKNLVTKNTSKFRFKKNDALVYYSKFLLSFKITNINKIKFSRYLSFISTDNESNWKDFELNLSNNLNNKNKTEVLEILSNVIDSKLPLTDEEILIFLKLKNSQSIDFKSLENFNLNVDHLNYLLSKCQNDNEFNTILEMFKNENKPNSFTISIILSKLNEITGNDELKSKNLNNLLNLINLMKFEINSINFPNLIQILINLKKFNCVSNILENLKSNNNICVISHDANSELNYSNHIIYNYVKSHIPKDEFDTESNLEIPLISHKILISPELNKYFQRNMPSDLYVQIPPATPTPEIIRNKHTARTSV